MKKMMLIVFVLFLIGCNHSTDQLSNSSGTTEEQLTVFKIKQINTIVSVYSDTDLEKEITILSAEEVLSVKEVLMTKESITSYKVELIYGNIGYVYADEFYILDTLTEAYNSYLTPVVNIDNIILGEELSSESFIDSYMMYDLYINGLVVEDSFTFIEGMRYEIYAAAADMKFISAMKVLDTELDRNYCKVRVDKDVESKELTRFLNYSDYKNRVVNCEISYKNGQIEIWYAIQLDDGTIGYSNDNLYHINDIDKLIVVTNTETIEIDSSDYRIFKSMPGVIQIDSQSRDELHIIDFFSESHYSYLGIAKFYEDNIFVVDYYKVNDESNRQLTLLMYADNKLKEVVTTRKEFNAFVNLSKDYNRNINFEAHFTKDFLWPLTSENRYVQYGSFNHNSNGYDLVYKYNNDFDEPLLENVELYEKLSDRTKTVGTFNSVDIYSSDNQKKLDIINGNIVCWFKIVTVDGKEGYAYRQLFDYELDFIKITGYKFKLSDGSEYTYDDHELYYNNENYRLSSDLAGIGLYTFVINRGYVAYNNSIDKDGFGLDYKKMVTEYAKLPDKEMIVSKFYGEYYHTVSESELTIYELTDNNYKAYYTITINNAKSGDFIWLDDNTISFFIIESTYEYDMTEYPSVLRRVDNKWVIESEYTDYEIN